MSSEQDQQIEEASAVAPGAGGKAEAVPTYATMSADQQQEIDARIKAIGTNYRQVYQFGGVEAGEMTELSLQVSRIDGSSAVQQVIDQIHAAVAENAAPAGAGQIKRDLRDLLQQIGVNIQAAEAELRDHQAVIEGNRAKLAKMGSAFQIAYATAREIEHRMIYGQASAAAKYDLAAASDGSDPRSFAVCLDGLKAKVVTSDPDGSALAQLQDLVQETTGIAIKTNELLEQACRVVPLTLGLEAAARANAQNRQILAQLAAQVAVSRGDMGPK